MQSTKNPELRFKKANGEEYADWEEKKLGEVANIRSSKRIFEYEYTNFGIPFYRTKEIKELSNNIKTSVEIFITVDKYNNIKANFGTPVRGDILLSAVGTIGVSWVVDNREFYFKDGNLIWLERFRGVHSQFLKFLFDHYFKVYKTDGSAYLALTIVSLKKIKIKLPSMEEQEKIAGCLSSLDKVIEKGEEETKNLKEYKKGLMQKLFPKHS